MQIEYATVFTQNPLNEMREPKIIANGNAQAEAIINKNTE